MSFQVEQSAGLREQDGHGYRPRLTRPEMVAIIDALLQAEMTLPLLDDRHGSLIPVQRLRSLQLALADRLEDLLAEDAPVQEAPP
jgi:hypothetical protein